MQQWHPGNRRRVKSSAKLKRNTFCAKKPLTKKNKGKRKGSSHTLKAASHVSLDSGTVGVMCNSTTPKMEIPFATSGQANRCLGEEVTDYRASEPGSAPSG